MALPKILNGINYSRWYIQMLSWLSQRFFCPSIEKCLFLTFHRNWSNYISIFQMVLLPIVWYLGKIYIQGGVLMKVSSYYTNAFGTDGIGLLSYGCSKTRHFVQTLSCCLFRKVVQHIHTHVRSKLFREFAKPYMHVFAANAPVDLLHIASYQLKLVVQLNSLWKLNCITICISGWSTIAIFRGNYWFFCCRQRLDDVVKRGMVNAMSRCCNTNILPPCSRARHCR